MDVVLSGIRSTGHLHLGNYFGALKNFVRIQDTHKCFFFIADLHSLTTHPHPADLHEGVKTILAEYLASGLDPEKSAIFVQSEVPEVSELYVLLNMLAYKGEMERTASFKDKVRHNPNNVNTGLLTYPVLMASDILIHRAKYVPVGKDQEQHLEMTRDFAQRFNRIYKNEYFKLPVAYNFGSELVKIPGLDGSTKMSKSDNENSCIYLSDAPEVIRKKVMKAVSDSGPTEPGQPKTQAVENLFQLMKAVSAPDTLQYFEDQYQNCAIRYGDMKKQLAADMIAFVQPVYERIQELKQQEDYISKVAREGAERARESAAKTVREVRDIIGIKSF